MWIPVALFGVILLGLCALVWVRQRRHPVEPGRHLSADQQTMSRGRFWGDGNGGAGG